MKKNFLKSWILGMVLVGGVFVACQKEDAAKPDTALTYQKEIDYLVETFGFKKEEIKVSDSLLIAQGDIAFSLNGFWEKYKQPVSSDSIVQDRYHYRTPNLVSVQQSPRTILLNIFSQVPNTWKTALLNGAKEWNKLNLNIRFNAQISNVTVPGAVNVISYYDANNGSVAYTGIPQPNGDPGPYLYINTAYNNMSSSRKKRVMAHELGHAVGFLHTDLYEGGYWVWEVPCSYSEDPSSVMRQNCNGCTTSPSWSGFSSCDKEVFNYFY